MRYIYIILFFLITTVVLAQDNQSVSIFDLEIPNNTAFILLDEAPETIQRPHSSRALGLSILQDIATDGILNDIAIEVTPFWLSSSTTRSALKFYGLKDDKKTQNYFSKLKMISFSAAYMKDSDSVLNASIGFRTTVIEIKRSDDIKDYLDAYNVVEKNLRENNLINEEFENKVGAPDEKPTGMSDEDYKIKTMDPYNERRKEYRKTRLKELSDPMAEIVKRKPAFALDVAGAYNHRFYDGEFNNNGTGRFGVWSTITSSFFLDRTSHGKYFNLYGFVRYLVEEDNPFFEEARSDQYNSFDIGIKAELELNKFTIAYEYINRSGDLEGYRSAGNIKYKAFDNVYLTGTFGNNFEPSDDLISLFGIQWGINNPVQSIGVSANQ